MGKPPEARGHQALMLVLHTKPSQRRTISLFPNMRAPGLNGIAYWLMPTSMPLFSFSLWHRCFARSRVTLRRRRAARALDHRGDDRG